MRLKLYRAPRMAQAIARVRAELGDDALILASRQVGDGVEVTAGLEQADDEPVLVPPTTSTQTTLRFHGVPDQLVETAASGDLVTALARQFAFRPLPIEPGQPPLLLLGRPARARP